MKKLFFIIICMCCMMLGLGSTASAATPRVMVSDYNIKEEQVISGEEFTLSLTLRNTAKNSVKNMKVSITTDNGEFLPVEGAGTSYIEQITAGAEEKLTFCLRVLDGLEEKSYKLHIKTEYESTNGMEYAVEDVIYIQVTHEQKISITEVFIANDQIKMGDIMEISAVVNNMGSGTIYNVMAEATGPNMDTMSTYLGNIEPGKSGFVDIQTPARLLTSDNPGKNVLHVTYEDKQGNKFEEEMVLGYYGMISVSEPVYEDLEKVKESVQMSGVVKQIVGWIAGIVVVVGVVLLCIRRKKKKQQMLDEFMA